MLTEIVCVRLTRLTMFGALKMLDSIHAADGFDRAVVSLSYLSSTVRPSCVLTRGNRPGFRRPFYTTDFLRRDKDRARHGRTSTSHDILIGDDVVTWMAGGHYGQDWRRNADHH